ncbi:hypothetical protein FS837_000620 [Tulasnella sp. UAMH 9824]|nr:hypothetical protein FS837_000620 [Tulasnella sp. UAMH 9824]
MFRTPGALSGAWAAPLPSAPPPEEHDPKPQPDHRPTLSVGQAHAHAFSTPKGWEAPERPPASQDLVPPNPDAIQSGADKPKWVLPYQRYDTEDIPYTIWEAVGSPTSSVQGASRSPIPPSSTCSAIDSTGWTPRAGGSDLSRAALSKARSMSPSSSYRTAKTHLTTWKWANEVIPDPDFPNEKPRCLSPRPSSVSSSRGIVRTKNSRQTKSVGDAANRAGYHGVEDATVEEYFGLPVNANCPPRRLTVSEVSSFGKIGTVENVWGEKLPECGLCKCEGFRLRYRLHGETCPLHIESMKCGPAALETEGAA